MHVPEGGITTPDNDSHQERLRLVDAGVPSGDCDWSFTCTWISMLFTKWNPFLVLLLYDGQSGYRWLCKVVMDYWVAFFWNWWIVFRSENIFVCQLLGPVAVDPVWAAIKFRIEVMVTMVRLRWGRKLVLGVQRLNERVNRCRICWLKWKLT